jgi:type VI secretion system secreted protein VgrG
MLRIDDAAGAEQIKIDASYDYDEQSGGNKATSVTGNELRIVGSKQELTYETNHSIKVDAPQTVGVGASRTVAGNDGMLIEAGSESVVVGAMRELTIGGHLTSKIGGGLTRVVGGAKVVLPLAGNSRFVNGSSVVMVAGGWMDLGATSSISVGGASLTTSAAALHAVGKYSLQASGLNENGGARDESAAATVALAAKNVTLNYGVTSLTGPTVCIKASSKITIDAGGATIEVTPGGVTFGGAMTGSGYAQITGKAEHG